MTIRKAWNLWRLLFMPCSLFFVYITTIILHVSVVGCIGVLFVFLRMYDLFSKRKCPKCQYQLNLYKYEELSMFTLYYWFSDLELRCKRCGQSLNEISL